MLWKKYAVAAVAIPLFLLLVLRGPSWGFAAFLSVVMAVSVHEFAALLRTRGLHVASLIIGAFSILVAWGFHSGGIQTGGAALLVGTFLVWFRYIVSRKDLESAPIEMFASAAVLFYVGWFFGHLVLLRDLPVAGSFPSRLTVYLFWIVWFGDTAADHMGRIVGKRKLAPVISPNKTIEGLVAGYLGNVFFAMLGSLLFVSEIPLIHAAGIGLVLGTLGHMGDLIESTWKRSFDVKDSSSLLPGHGGLLDRLDSIALSAPGLYYYVVLVIGLGAN